ncbi:MAG: CYTH domain-containing protein [Elusimicrobiota bacterium]
MMNMTTSILCRRLGIVDSRCVEIESKKRIMPEEAEDIRKYLLKRKNVVHVKRAAFFDQFLDTPGLDLLKRGASLRLRYKGDGSSVYLQYKGPGFYEGGLLYRSEFSSERLDHLVREESHHDIVRFGKHSIRDILKMVDPGMSEAMRRHLGSAVLRDISRGPILCAYQKDKFRVDLGSAFLEPSLDRLFAFHISRSGPHALSTFWEYENEIKTKDEDAESKLELLDDLREFDAALSRKFDLRPERIDKYHRCASYFLPRRKIRGRF